MKTSMAKTAGYLLAGLMAFGLPTDSRADDYQKLIRQCQNDPAYRVGGAAVGECLEVRVGELDKRMGTLLKTQAKSMCKQPLALMREAQKQWQEYRGSFCQVFPALFDNTAMYVNSQACALRLTLARLDDLKFLNTYRPGQPLPCED